MFNPLANITWRIGAIIAGVCAGLFFIGLATQTIRIEGLKLWPISVTGFKDDVKTLRMDLDLIKTAQEMARLKAEEAKAKIEAQYRAQAERTDNEYQEQLADANARADAYARRMRVKAPSRGTGKTTAAPESNGPESFDGPGEDAFVAVSRPDFDTLVENTLRLQKAHEWAKSLENRSNTP